MNAVLWLALLSQLTVYSVKDTSSEQRNSVPTLAKCLSVIDRASMLQVILSVLERLSRLQVKTNVAI